MRFYEEHGVCMIQLQMHHACTKFVDRRDAGGAATSTVSAKQKESKGPNGPPAYLRYDARKAHVHVQVAS